MEDNLISWRLDNLISVIAMLIILWVLIGAASHFLFRMNGSSAPATTAG